MARAVPQEQVQRVAQMYHNSQDASGALGITTRSFSRLCRLYGIETPWMRKRRTRAEAHVHRLRPKPS